MSTEEKTTRLLAQLEEGIRLAPERQCPCGHRAREHRDGGCPCQDCDLRAFEVEQGCVTYRDTDTRVSLQEHLDGIRSGRVERAPKLRARLAKVEARIRQLDPPSRGDGAVVNVPLARRMPTDNQIAELARLVHERDRLRAEVGA